MPIGAVVFGGSVGQRHLRAKHQYTTLVTLVILCPRVTAPTRDSFSKTATWGRFNSILMSKYLFEWVAQNQHLENEAPELINPHQANSPR